MSQDDVDIPSEIDDILNLKDMKSEISLKIDDDLQSIASSNVQNIRIKTKR